MLNNNNSFNFNVNTARGTLRKSHSKSKFCIRELDNRTWIFNERKPRIDFGDGVGVVVLQVMLIGDNKALIEYVDERYWDVQQSVDIRKEAE